MKFPVLGNCNKKGCTIVQPFRKYVALSYGAIKLAYAWAK